MQIAENLRKIRHQVIVMSGKGGVGKSTVAVNLAAAFAEKGWKVGLLDLDLTNPNVPLMVHLEGSRPRGSAEGRIEPVKLRENLSVMSTAFFLDDRKEAIVWRGPIKMKMIQDFLGQVAWGELDVLVVDLPPGTGDEPLSIAQLLKDADGVVVVTTPQSVSVLDVRKSMRFAATMGLPVLGIVENMAGFVCPHCRHETDVFSRGGGAAIADEFKVPLLASVPLEPAVVESGEEGMPFVWKGGGSPAAVAFRALAEAVAARLEEEGSPK